VIPSPPGIIRSDDSVTVIVWAVCVRALTELGSGGVVGCVVGGSSLGITGYGSDTVQGGTA
jgi:hypothetical protein